MDIFLAKVQGFWSKTLRAFKGHRTLWIAGCASIAGLAGLMVGYSYYDHWVQVSAHKDLIAAMRYFDAPVGKGKTVVTAEIIEYANETDKWKKVEEIFKEKARKHRGAGIAPIFQAYLSEALMHQGRIDEARELLATTIKLIASGPIREFFEIKLALMNIDSTKADLQQEGLLALKKIAENAQHSAHELGLYYLGYFYWTRKDFAQVKNYWQQYMVKYGFKDSKFQTGLADSVREKLRLISTEW